MLVGETQALVAERIKRWTPKLWRKEYIFQIRHGYGKDHFRGISRRFKLLYFVLVYHAPNVEQYGSYLIRQGHYRQYVVPKKLINSLMAKHNVEDVKNDEDEWRFEDEWRLWQASFEVMDLAQTYWERHILSR
jgi:hypothetical protein